MRMVRRNHYELTRKDHMVKNLKRMVNNLRRQAAISKLKNHSRQ